MTKFKVTATQIRIVQKFKSTDPGEEKRQPPIARVDLTIFLPESNFEFYLPNCPVFRDKTGQLSVGSPSYKDEKGEWKKTIYFKDWSELQVLVVVAVKEFMDQI